MALLIFRLAFSNRLAESQQVVRRGRESLLISFAHLAWLALPPVCWRKRHSSSPEIPSDWSASADTQLTSVGYRVETEQFDDGDASLSAYVVHLADGALPLV